LFTIFFQIEKLYSGLQGLSADRTLKLENAVKLFTLNRRVEDLAHWIEEKEVVAKCQELGQDFEHVNLLIERFRDFAADTKSVGEQQLSAVVELADSLIASGHADSAAVAQWKDSLLDAWDDLMELIETRMQMLETSQELHKYFYDCRDVLSSIIEKSVCFSEELGRDAESVSALQRKHQNVILDLQSLHAQVAILLIPILAEKFFSPIKP
jgi:spectrin beta